MTRKLESLFDLSPADETPQAELALLEQDQVVQLEKNLETVDKIDAALPLVTDLEANDTEMDEVADSAKKAFEDLMDLAMNVDSRFSGKIFETAGQMLGHVITAKNAKIDKKLRMIDLQLKKRRLDIMEKKQDQAMGDTEDAEGFVVDRNTLLAEILGKKA